MDEEVMAYRLCTEKRVGSKKFSTGFSGFEKDQASIMTSGEHHGSLVKFIEFLFPRLRKEKK